jgi:cardiolipin synthase
MKFTRLDFEDLFAFCLSLGLSLYVLTRRREPSNTMAWILSFFLFPYFSTVLYMFFGFQRYRRDRKPKPHPRAANPGPEGEGEVELNVSRDLQSEVRNLATLAELSCGFPVVGRNAGTVYIEPEPSYDALEEAIEKAKNHVHLQTYIFADDAMGRRFGDLLAAAVKRGVECRLLIDSVGSLFLPGRVVKGLRAAGVHVAFFSHFRRFKRLWHLHLRNHRKIAIVDGAIGFIGSQNILDNLAQFPGPSRPWHDAQLKIEGPAVKHLQSVFLEDWRFATGHTHEGERYFPVLKPAGDLELQVVPSGPDLAENVLHGILLAMIHTAQKRVTVITPYLVPSQAIVLALQSAARRGVEVSILLPAKPDNVFARFAGRSWFMELLVTGVRIFESPESAVHSKVIVIDDHVTFLGSANLDVRSYQLNFEASIIVYGLDPTKTLHQQAVDCVARATEVHLDDVRKRPMLTHVAEGCCRLFAPLL